MAYYYGDLNIAMLKSFKREPSDLPLEDTIVHILAEPLFKLYYKLNVKDLYNLKIFKFYYNFFYYRLPQYFNVYHGMVWYGNILFDIVHNIIENILPKHKNMWKENTKCPETTHRVPIRFSLASCHLL